MTFRPELCCPRPDAKGRKEARWVLHQLRTQHQPTEMNRVVSQLTEPSLTPTAPYSQGSIPSVQMGVPAVTSKCSLNRAESWRPIEVGICKRQSRVRAKGSRSRVCCRAHWGLPARGLSRLAQGLSRLARAKHCRSHFAHHLPCTTGL